MHNHEEGPRDPHPPTSSETLREMFLFGGSPGTGYRRALIRIEEEARVAVVEGLSVESLLDKMYHIMIQEGVDLW